MNLATPNFGGYHQILDIVVSLSFDHDCQSLYVDRLMVTCIICDGIFPLLLYHSNRAIISYGTFVFHESATGIIVT